MQRLDVILGASLLLAGLSGFEPEVSAPPPPRTPTRVVSLTLASDVLVSRLAPAQLIAVTAAVDTPLSSVVVPSDVPRVTSDVEPLLALRPDLVVAASYTRPATLRSLTEAGIAIHVLDDIVDFDSMRVATTRLAAALHVDPTPALAPLASQSSCSEALRGTPVLYLAAGGFSAGCGTLVDAAIRRLELRNLACEHGRLGHVRIDPEALMSMAPGYLLIGANSADEGRTVRDQHLAAWPTATARPRILRLPPRALETTTPDLVPLLSELTLVTEGTP